MNNYMTTYDYKLARQKFLEGYDVFIANPDPRDDVQMTNEDAFADADGHLFEIKHINPSTLTGPEVALVIRLINSMQGYFEVNLDSSDVYSSEYLDYMLKTNQLREKLELLKC
jgi:hypothetical protein